MKIRRSVFALGACVAVLALAAAGPASAASIAECQTKIAATATALAGVEIGGGNPERTRAGLQSKLDGAAIKLDEAKFCDATAKLVEFGLKVDELATPNRKGETKLAANDAADLVAAASDAETCVRAFDPTCP